MKIRSTHLLIPLLLFGALHTSAQLANNPTLPAGRPASYLTAATSVANSTGGSTASGAALMGNTPAGLYGGFAYDGSVGSGGRVSFSGTPATNVMTVGGDLQNSNQQNFNQVAAGGTGALGVTNYFQYTNPASGTGAVGYKANTTTTITNTAKGPAAANQGGVSYADLFIGAGTDAKAGQLYVFNTHNLVINKTQGTDQAYGAGATATTTSNANIFVQNTTMDVDGVATFTSGRIYLGDATNAYNDKFVVEPGGSVTGGNINAFVDGNMQNLNTGNTPQLFPMGDNNLYSPVTLTPPVSYTTTATGTTLRYVSNAHVSGGNTYGTAENNVNSKQAPVVRVSSMEFFTVTSDAPVGTSITMRYDNFGPGYVIDPAKLLLVGWDGTQWVNLGISTAAGGVLTTTLTRSLAGITQFTLGSTDAINPLPITWLDFNAVKKNSSATLLTWAIVTKDISGFTITRSTDGINFTTIASVGSSTYTYTDNSPAPGVNYYRIIGTEITGNTTLTPVRTVNFGSDATVSVTGYPNPVLGSLNIVINGYTGKAPLVIYNAIGQLMYSATLAVSGSAKQVVDMNGYAPGSYMLVVRNSAGIIIGSVPVIRK